MTTSSEVPGKFPVAINGRPYMVDPAGFRRESLPILRQQSDTSDLPSEASLNPRALWRRSQESWHHGSGQTLFDGKSSGTAADPERFSTSHNVNVWTRGQISLMPETVMVAPPSGGGAPTTPASHMVAAANHLYIAETSNVYWASNPTVAATTWTSAVINAGEGAQTVRSLATDGYYIWAALGTSGLHRTVRGASSSTANVPAAPAGGNIGLVGYALGRLLVAGSATSTTQRNVLWEVTNTISSPTLSPATAPYLMTHQNTGFVWMGITPGRNCIYVFGNTPGDVLNLSYGVDQGGTGEVYKVSLSATDTALTTPSPATYLPDGESIHDVRFYAGGIILATSRGLRLGQADSAGNVDYGPLVATTKPVLALEPQDRYVWFTGSNEGLHRADLGWFSDPLTPAWAPDVVITATSDTQALVKAAVSLTSAPGPVFLYQGAVISGIDPSGVYRPSATVLKPSGYVETGQIRFGTTESKTLRRVDIRHHTLPAGASVVCDMKRDGGSWENVGMSAIAGSASASLGIGQSLRFESDRANVVSTPDSAALSFSDDIDLRVKLTMDDWTPGTGTSVLMAKDHTGSRSWRWELGSTNNATTWTWSTDGTTMPISLSQAFPAQANGATKWLRVTHDVDNGAAQHVTRFYSSDDGVTWVLDGSNTQAGTVTRFDSTAPVTVGGLSDAALSMVGTNIHRAEMRNGIDGPVVAALETAGVVTTASQVPASFAQGDVTWTVSGTDWEWLKEPAVAETVELRFTLYRGTDTTTGPTVLRWTLKALPTPSRPAAFTLPLLLHSSVVDLNDADTPVDVPAEVTALKALEEAGTIVEFQVGDITYEGFIEESQHQGGHWSKAGNPHRYIEGTYTVRMVTV